MHTFPVKNITFLGRIVPILCQNENGPCPLLAIANVLLLQKRMSFNGNYQNISLQILIQTVANRLIELNPEHSNPDLRLNQQKQIDSVIQLLPKLEFGLGINVKFYEPNSFEYTEECTIFDMLDISLYHGWLIDPQDINTYNSLNNVSYNHAVELIIESRSNNENDHNENEIKLNNNNNKFNKTNEEIHYIETFLEDSSSQLTYYGLLKLHEKIKERELCVFFRNNHFSTLFKYENELYLLVTDQGYQHVNEVVWEKLTNIDGDTSYFDHEFLPTSHHQQRREDERNAQIINAIENSVQNVNVNNNNNNNIPTGMIVNEPSNDINPNLINNNNIENINNSQKFRQENGALLTDEELSRLIAQEEEFYRLKELNEKKKKKKNKDSGCNIS